MLSVYEEKAHMVIRVVTVLILSDYTRYIPGLNIKSKALYALQNQ